MGKSHRTGWCPRPIRRRICSRKAAGKSAALRGRNLPAMETGKKQAVASIFDGFSRRISTGGLSVSIRMRAIARFSRAARAQQEVGGLCPPILCLLLTESPAAFVGRKRNHVISRFFFLLHHKKTPSHKGVFRIERRTTELDENTSCLYGLV